MAKYFLIALLIVEALAALWSFSAQKSADLLIKKTDLIKQEINAWEKVLTEENELRDVLLRLSILSYQLYEDEQAKAYWQRAFYLDPGFVSSLPCFLPACPP